MQKLGRDPEISRENDDVVKLATTFTSIILQEPGCGDRLREGVREVGQDEWVQAVAEYRRR